MQLLREHRPARWQTPPHPAREDESHSTSVSASTGQAPAPGDPDTSTDEQRRLAVACRNYYRTMSTGRHAVDANTTVLKPDGNSPKSVVHRPGDSNPVTPGAARPAVTPGAARPAVTPGDARPDVTPGAARPAVTGRETNKWHFTDNDDIELLHDVAHGLHFASIGVLGFLVLEVRTNTRLQIINVATYLKPCFIGKTTGISERLKLFHNHFCAVHQHCLFCN